tara:strand:+ start:662 stop:826 length:165 start_codon:yes stop_codon:yes gene_type:complete
MSKECRTARNMIVISMIILIAFVVIASKAKDLQIKQSQDEYYNSLGCQNCDEID